VFVHRHGRRSRGTERSWTRISAFISLILLTIVPALGDFGPGLSGAESVEGPSDSDLIWEGEVLLSGGEVNFTRTGGDLHSISEKSALGALIRASDAGGFELELDSSLWSIRGPIVESIGGRLRRR
jgi:hypothetical protein